MRSEGEVQAKLDAIDRGDWTELAYIDAPTQTDTYPIARDSVAAALYWVINGDAWTGPVCHGTWSHENTEMIPIDDGNYQCPECGIVIRFSRD